ncbi:MAG: hypothetical protein EOL91_01465 [Actinobacteria bacterium]|nr:hypothetical protein [Actinomycetota bacterium]
MNLPTSFADFPIPNTARAILLEALAWAELLGLHPAAKRVADYVRLSANESHTVAVYVHRNRFSISLDPDDARNAVAAFPDLDNDWDSPSPTAHLIVKYDTLRRGEGRRDALLELFDSAFLRSVPHVYADRAANRRGQPIELCPTCNLAMVNGTCDYCAS